MRKRASKRRAIEVLERLLPLYGHLTTGLRFNNPLELLVATILSAQCTDERVNMVTPALFARYPGVSDYAEAGQEELEVLVHSCGFFRAKARNIRGMATTVRDRFGGRVPANMAELTTLPGVARKTANVVLSHAFGRNEGIAVDTHVQRLARRLGFSAETDPVKIEADLMRLIPRSRWGETSDLLIWHGRTICYARSPHCDECVLVGICPSAGTG